MSKRSPPFSAVGGHGRPASEEETDDTYDIGILTTHCNTLRHTATHATHCNTLRHSSEGETGDTYDTATQNDSNGA